MAKPPRIRQAIALPLNDDDPDGAAAWAGIKAAHSRAGAGFAGRRWPRPGRKVLVAVAAFALITSAVGAIAALSTHPAEGDSKNVAATRPAVTSNTPSPTLTSPTTNSATPQVKKSTAGRATPTPTPTTVPATRDSGSQDTAPAVPAPQPSKTTAPAPAKPAPAPPATTATTFHITGQVLCQSGRAVVGVWVQTGSNADSRFAAWQGIGDGSSASWSTDLPKNESYSLHVGCGGSPSSWATSNTTGTYSGAQNSFDCDDIATDPSYEKCTHR